jgi:hypothetical protein
MAHAPLFLIRREPSAVTGVLDGGDQRRLVGAAFDDGPPDLDIHPGNPRHAR